MKFCFISDTHNQHGVLQLPEADVLVHAGDLSIDGSLEECIAAVGWLNAQPHKHVVMIAGNHDFAFEKPNKKALIDLGRIHYLENSEVEIEGVRFWGSPVTPWFYDWAFNVHRGEPIKKFWDKIPDHTDVLITHGPPYSVLDQSRPNRSDHLGCEGLLAMVTALKPSIHVFGHIHGSSGVAERDWAWTKFINASVVDEAYQVVNQPYVTELET